MANSDYTRGKMEITDHEGTFSGFMGISKYGAVTIIVMLMFPILTFAANVAWLAALIISVVLGVVLGFVLKFKVQWYASMIGFAIFLGVVIALLLLLF